MTEIINPPLSEESLATQAATPPEDFSNQPVEFRKLSSDMRFSVENVETRVTRKKYESTPADVIARFVKDFNFPSFKDVKSFTPLGDGWHILPATVRAYNQNVFLYRDLYSDESMICTITPEIINNNHLSFEAASSTPTVQATFKNCSKNDGEKRAIGPKPDDPMIQFPLSDFNMKKAIGGIILQYNADTKAIDVSADGLELGEYMLKLSFSLDGAQRDFWMCVKVVERPLFTATLTTSPDTNFSVDQAQLDSKL